MTDNNSCITSLSRDVSVESEDPSSLLTKELLPIELTLNTWDIRCYGHCEKKRTFSSLIGNVIRLTCVEENPGPKKKQKMTSTCKTTIPLGAPLAVRNAPPLAIHELVAHTKEGRQITLKVRHGSLFCQCGDAVVTPPVSPPAKPLVGVEPNPGPIPLPKGTIQEIAAKVKQQIQGGGKKKKKRGGGRRGGGGNNGGSMGMTLTKAYIDTLRDPFQHGPLRLGFGTMVPTTVGTAFLRTSITSHTDGSFGAVLFPSLGSVNSAVATQISGAGSFSWAFTPYANLANVTSLFDECRVVSAGIRVMPLTAPGGIPGVLYTGSISTTSSASFILNNITGLSNLPNTEFGPGDKGATMTYRPTDFSSYEFNENVKTHTNTGWVWNGSCPFIVGKNFPASTIVIIEFVINLEGISGTGATAASNIDSDSNPKLSDYVPSLDALWARVSRELEHPGQFTANLDSMVNTFVKANTLYQTGVRAFSGRGRKY